MNAKKHNIPVFVDPKGDEFDIYQGANFLKPNIKEFENIVGVSTNKKEFNSKAYKNSSNKRFNHMPWRRIYNKHS